MTLLRRELQHALKIPRMLEDPIPCGYDTVRFQGAFYEPDPDGDWAVIVPVCEGAELVDLCATDLRGRRTATRSGLSNFLGWDAVDHALLHQSCLHLFADPIAWLNGHCEGAVVLDWKSSIYVLSDLVAISFDNDLLARGVLQALKRPLPVPELFVREEPRHAA